MKADSSVGFYSKRFERQNLTRQAKNHRKSELSGVYSIHDQSFVSNCFVRNDIGEGQVRSLPLGKKSCSAPQTQLWLSEFLGTFF